MLKDVVHIVAAVLKNSSTISSSILMNVTRRVKIYSCISLYTVKEEHRYALIKHKIAKEDFKIILYKLINVVFNSFVHTEKAMRFSFVICLCFSAYNYGLPYRPTHISLLAAQFGKYTSGCIMYRDLTHDNKNERHLNSEAYGIPPYNMKDTKHILVQKLCRQNPVGCILIFLYLL
jgi:hypothetical protein